MLSKIEVNGFTIKMKSENHNNIYDIDSLNLLIGKNGSGKTKALCEIVTTKNKSIIVSHVKLLQSEIKKITDHLCHYLFEEILSCNDEISTFSAFAVAENMISKKESNYKILQALNDSLLLPNIPIVRIVNNSANTFTDEIKILSHLIRKLRGRKVYDDFLDQYNSSYERFIFELEIDPYLDELFQEQVF